MKRKFYILLLCIAFLLAACKQEEITQPSTQEQYLSPADSPNLHIPEAPPEPLHIFHDEAVRNSVERFFNKDADELTQEDLNLLAGLYAFILDSFCTPVTSLSDLSELFPSLRHIHIGFSWHNAAELSEIDLAILRDLPYLRAVELFVDGLPCLDFITGLPYVSLRYTEDAIESTRNNLAQASVLGRDFIESQMVGRIREYIRVIIGERVYELIVTDYISITDSFGYIPHEARLFVSEKRDGEYYLLDILDIPGRFGNASGGLILMDVNFDGHRDILVLRGHSGTQGSVSFTCFIYHEGTYTHNPSFSGISNPRIDAQNQRILSVWRNWAASHGRAMFLYVDGVFVITDILTTEPEEVGERRDGEPNAPVYVWRYTVESVRNGNIETKIYLTNDFTEDEFFAKFYDENSFWALLSDRWRSPCNYGIPSGWSIHGRGLDAQIMEIISR